MHALDKWIKDNSISRKILATNLNISIASLSRYLSGDRIPKQEIMEKIISYTDGKINPSNFYIAKNNKNNNFSEYRKDHLLGIEDLKESEISSLLNRADDIIRENRIARPSKILKS